MLCAVTLENVYVRAVVLTRPGQFGVYARNLTTGEIVGVDSDAVMKTESAIKTAILLQYTHLVAAGNAIRARASR